MIEKPFALIVDDDDKWLLLLEQVLEADYQVLKAKSHSEVNKIIQNKGLQLKVALVDIRLDDDKDNDDSGLQVMFSLNKIGVPCIATTSYNNGDAIRAALLIGRAKDVWFKNERKIVLQNKIENIEKRVEEERKNAIETINFDKEFWKLMLALLLIPFTILILMLFVFYFVPNNYILIVGSATGLIIAIYGFLALFYNKITGDQLINLLKIPKK
jgi:CheY-like chemotaxis protein